jgi:hypothetical protein
MILHMPVSSVLPWNLLITKEERCLPESAHCSQFFIFLLQLTDAWNLWAFIIKMPMSVVGILDDGSFVPLLPY